MTRINTNVSSLLAQNNLSKANGQLQESLTRLSTGLRINSGKDDPAGLIASEELRSDIVGVEKAITNSERANQLIATADSALGQVSSLLNDIRGLVSEAANTGVLSEDQLAANQLQVDSSLEAIDRIAQVTSFQGNRLLDGSLDFNTSAVSNTQVTDLRIDQANFGALAQIGVSIDVASQASRGELNFDASSITGDTTLEIGGSNGFEAFNFAAGSTVSQIADAVNLVSDATGVGAEVVNVDAQAGSVTVSSFGTDNDIVLTANEGGVDASNIRVSYDSSAPGQALGVAYTAASGDDAGTLAITLATSAATGATTEFDDAGDVNNALSITANVASTEFNGVEIAFDNTAALGANVATVAYDHNGGTGGVGLLTIGVDSGGGTTAADIIAELAGAGNEQVAELFTIANVGESDGSGAVDVNGVQATLAGGDAGGAITSTANDIIAAINGDAGAAADLTASLGAGNDGHDVVSGFSEFAYSGSEAADNLLQFLAPDGANNISFVNGGSNQTLSVDLTSDPDVTDFASTVVQGNAADSSFTITARQRGSEFDGITIDVNAGAAADTVVFDENAKTLTINVSAGAPTAADVVNLVNNDTYVNDLFSASVFGGGAGAGNVNSTDTSVTSGGITSAGSVIVNLATDATGQVTTTANDLLAYFDDTDNAAALAGLGISVSNGESSDGTGILEATTSDIEFATTGQTVTDAASKVTTSAANGAAAQLTLTALTNGAEFDGVTIQFEDTVTQGNEEFSYDANSKTLTISAEDGVSTAANVVAAFANADASITDLFSLTETAGVGLGTGTVTVFDTGVTSGGTVTTGSAQGAALQGGEDAGAGALKFVATDFGSKNFVAVNVLSGNFDLTDSTGAASGRSTGTDLDARINGIQVVADGLRASINTASLDLTFALDSSVASGTTIDFDIRGGGAQFQLGPDVVSNQQARLGIQSVSTARLGGVNGRLFELKSGGSKSLTNDVTAAAKIVEETITQVTSIRGRLGAFQKTTLESNIITLNDTLTNLTDAESSIRDADFASESARLTRAQILVQSSTSVLGIANSNPQNVLALLR